jgi:hypothetical protein
MSKRREQIKQHFFLHFSSQEDYILQFVLSKLKQNFFVNTFCSDFKGFFSGLHLQTSEKHKKFPSLLKLQGSASPSKIVTLHSNFGVP